MTKLPQLQDFPSHDYDKLRFGDTDLQGHINNAVFMTLFETGRTKLIVQALELADGWHQGPTTTVIARVAIDFRAEMLWPGKIDIGSAVKTIGTSSVTFTQALFQGETCTATAEAVLVHISKQTRRALPLTPEMRRALERYLLHD